MENDVEFKKSPGYPVDEVEFPAAAKAETHSHFAFNKSFHGKHDNSSSTVYT